MKPFIHTFSAIIFSAAFAANAADFSVESPTLKTGTHLLDAQVLNGFGCSGQNRSPAISWKNAPKGTKSFAITLYDPDAPTGSGWWHWVVYNIPRSTSGLPEDAGKADGTKLPQGAVQGRTDFGAPGYGGACPPAGDKPHHYIVTVSALDVEKIDLPADASAAMVGFMMHAHRIAVASLSAEYSR